MTKEKKILSETDFQRKCDEFTYREVLQCQSPLISHLLSMSFNGNVNSDLNYLSIDDVENLYYPVCSECHAPVEPLTDKQIEKLELKEGAYGCTSCDCTYGESAVDELDTEPQDIMEWWLVSKWLHHELRKHGAPVLSDDFNYWWGRTTSGQAVASDSIIRDIVTEAWNIKSNNKY
jgi:hypothetical protein